MTRPYAEVIGDPIAHSRSPRIHGFWLEQLGIEADYRACHVRPDALGDYIASRRTDRNWRGCNVTIPHKEAILPLLDTVDARARAVGAVNTVLRDESGTVLGTNTDLDGIAEAIAGVALEGATVTVLGAGGAARAAFALLAGTPCAGVRILARRPEQARAAARDCGLAAEILPFAPGAGGLAGSSLLINATQLGMTGQAAMPEFVLEELGAMAPGGLVFDMVYAPLDTRLLLAARGQALATSDGLVMLVGQAATAFARFFGMAAPRACDARLRAMLLA
ncbi:shikimate dehydrogenase family protein [Novosphingobium album (ex Liu et al. 2023)]|uniref:Shikimate dehydrogenase (NADP(+)) n=1 Tax=Novosphingobium album (ex Liu et al. 2023) TaxID=3031130 RepID=A0ABT5WP12_9SPHN|nr:shikimate dehydrogenase [Novosphingobium album (ex Liu et al. 2023)]MDE8651768.1 shikimate dehydrogenase [Novosphingobium album (ex Liu et al. 2023)]